MKKIILLFFLLLSLMHSGYSQVQVGSGSNIVQNFPMNTSSYYTYSQSVYLASEINASGEITSIQWYFNGSTSLPNSQNLVIYMGTTSKSSFASNTDWEPVSNLTQVYSGGITTNSAPGWKTITLNTAFSYDGTSNLIVAVDENASGNDSGAANKFWNTEVESVRSIAYYNNITNPIPASPPTAVITKSFVPDIIFGGLTPACKTPYYFSVSEITDTTAKISWQASPSVPSGGSDYYFSTSITRPLNNTTPMGSILSGTTAVLSPLMPNTKYYVWVRNKCDGGVSGWSEMTQLTTDCAPVGNFIEDFESATPPNLPVCWSKILRGPSLSSFAAVQTVSNAANANSGLNSVSMNNSNSVDSYDIILVSPNLTSLTGPHRLKFYAKGAVDIEVGTLNSNLNDATFNVYEVITSTNTMTQYIVDFNSYHGSDKYVGFRLKASIQDQFVNLDDIQWEYIPLCDDVKAISVPSVTATTATFNWIAGNSETIWDIAVGELNETDPSVLPFNTTSQDPIYTKNELMENTAYKVWVRSVCTAGNGSWIGPVLFQTDCAPVDHFSESFDGVTTPNLPTCWSKITRGAALALSAGVKTISNNNYKSSPNSLLLSNTSSTGEFDIIAVSPNLSTLSAGNYRVRFFAKGAGALDVGTLDSNTKTATFTNIETLPTTSSYAQYVIEFTDTSITDTHIGIRLSSTVQQSNIYLDNIVFEPIPLCPDVTQVQVESVTDTEVTITWNHGSEQDWDIAVHPINVSDPTGLPYESTKIPGIYTKNGLSPLTQYQVWVRSVCGANKGSWIGQVPFITNCATVESFSQDFQNATLPNLPDCWTKILRGSTLDVSVGGAYVKTNNTDFDNTTPNWGELANKASSGSTYDVILVSPPVSTLTLGTYRLRFKAKRVSESVNLQIGTLDDNSNTGNFSLLTTVELGTSYKEYKIYFDKFNGTTNQYIGLRLNAINGYKTIKIDDIYWEPAPLCADVDNIRVPEVTTTSASVFWDVIGSEKKWDVCIAPVTVTSPDGLPYKTTPDNSGPFFEYTELSPGTVYNVWVRANCDHGVTGAWIGPIRFNTDCNPVESFNEGFNVTPFPYLPTCWDKIIRNGAAVTSNITNSLDSPNAAHSKPGYVTIFSDNSQAGADVIMVSPAISTLNQAANYQLCFYASGSNTLQVGTLNNKTINAIFTKVADVNVLGVNGNDNKTLHCVDMSTAKATDKYIAFKIVTGYMGGSQQYISMDDIKWEPKLGTDQFDMSQFNYFPNPVKDVLNISYTANINTVTVYNLLGQEIMQSAVNHTEAKINMSNLQNGPYLVKVALDGYVKMIKIIKE